jgi:glycosyltransferase involved in cell wall biosynthesis
MSGPDATARPLKLAFLGEPNSVHTRRWAGFFADRGHEIHFIVPDNDAISVPPDPRFQVHRFRAWPPSRIRGRPAVMTLRSLGRVLREIDPDVLHSHAVTRYGLAAWLSRFRPYAITVWGSDVMVIPFVSRRRRIYTWLALRGAGLVTGGSEALVQAAIAAGARPSRTHYVHFGVDVVRFSPGPAPAELRTRLGLDGHRVVFSSRRIAPLYRHEVVIEALASLPDDVVVLMTRHGALPEELARIEARAAELGLSGRIRLVPEVAHAEMPDFYRLADVVISVPASDGGPNTVVEAIASGRPIVASDLPANREWLTELDPAALVPVGDAEATARALLAILGRPESDRDDLAARARAAVEDRADQRVSMAEMERLYRELASRRRGSWRLDGGPADPTAR